MNESNILIENMTSNDLILKIKNISSSNHEIKNIIERNQINFICDFFSEPLMENGLYKKDVRFRDLIILYYIDYYIKEKLSIYSLKIEKYLNITLLSLHEKNKLSKRSTDKQNSFGKLNYFFNNDLNNEDQEKIVKKFNEIYDTTFTVKKFKEDIRIIVGLRNFTLHHYPIVSYAYAGKIKNGERHIEKDGKDISLNKTIESLSNFISKKAAQRLIEKLKKILNKYNFSTEEIKLDIIFKYKEMLNFKSLENVRRENIHFSITDLINERNVIY